jgi:hypothetical protein
MKPVIVHPQGDPGNACLIDLHASVYTKSVQGINLPPGKVAQASLKAVAIKHLRAGEIATLGGITYPSPCHVVATSVWAINNPMSRGIYPDAAEALLTMNHGLKAAVAPMGDFTMAEDAAGFNQWHFLIAWGWSLWQAKHLADGKWPLERRWREMKAVGYPGKEGAFRQVCSRLKLSVTDSRPIL